MKARVYDCHAGCPVEAVLDLIGGRWKGMILYNLAEGPVRFNELRRRIPGATQRVLTRQLRELEEAGIVARRVTPSVPPRVDYELTDDLGRSLAPVIATLWNWGVDYLGSAPSRHMRDETACQSAQPVGR